MQCRYKALAYQQQTGEINRTQKPLKSSINHVAALPKGMYLLQLTNDETNERKVFKVRKD